MRLFVICSLCCLQSLHAATYYVDFDGGDDTSAGTSQGAAWKTIPGTRNTADSAYVSTTYGGGVVSTTSKVQPGDTFNLKSGTIHNSSDGGKVMFDSNYYSASASLSNPITIRRDTTWGTGAVIIDGTGFTMGGGGFGLFHLKVPGMVIDATTTLGIQFANSPYDGISQYPTGPIAGPIINNCLFTNCGTSYTPPTENASDGSIRIAQSTTGLVMNCTVLGGGNGMQGFSAADSSWVVTSFVVSNCWVQDLVGTDNNDGGIGFKGQNSQITYIGCTATNCAKGFDHGENQASDTSVQMIYKLINCDSINNTIMGVGLSNAGFERDFPTFALYYVINCKIWGNPIGIKSYAGSYSNHVIHSVLAGNGISLLMHRDGLTDNNTNYCQVFNSILYKPTGSDGNMDHGYWQNAETIGHYYSDYNSYTRNGTEYFSRFGNYGGGSDTVDLSYGINGPGQSSGTWYAFKSWGNDVHSKGTGSAVDTTEPPFANAVNHNYALTENYLGTNLTARSWFIPEMGINADGSGRITWDLGPQDVTPAKRGPQKVRGLRLFK